MSVRSLELGGANVLIFADAATAARAAADRIAETVRGRPGAVLGLATGKTPVAVYKRLVALSRAGELSFAQATTYNLDEFYPINPLATELDRLRCYATISDVPRGVDLGIVAVPRALVLEVVDQCAQADVKSLVVITAGFAETGEEGRALQKDGAEPLALESIIHGERGFGGGAVDGDVRSDRDRAQLLVHEPHGEQRDPASRVA